MVFFSSCNSVKFHSELLNYIDIPVLDIHVSTSYIVHVALIYQGSPLGKFEGIVGGRSLGGGCDHINHFGNHIKDVDIEGIGGAC